jgi:acyl-coenzyme A thioesterase PaaI-like protein
MDITALPFNRLVGIERSTIEGAVLGIPANEKYTNHLGTVHASALLALAEATSGECLIAGLASAGIDVVPLVRRIEAKFRRTAAGAIHSRLGDMGDSMREFRVALAAKGRALVSIPVDVLDASGTLVLTSRVDWFVTAKARNSPKTPSRSGGGRGPNVSNSGAHEATQS